MFYILSNEISKMTLLAGQQEKEMNPGVSCPGQRKLQGPAVTADVQVDVPGHLWLAQVSVDIQAGEDSRCSVSWQWQYSVRQVTV